MGMLGWALLFLGTSTTAPVRAEDPPPEPLPAPRQAEQNTVPGVWPLHAGYCRRSRYEVWQYYGVDRAGYFRPRVILAPYDSSYFLYNGQAFPWVSTHQREFMPYVSDVP